MRSKAMSHSFQFTIEQTDAGRRLDEFLASRFGSLSRMRIANEIEAGACHINGDLGRAGYRLAVGDSLDVSFDDGAPTAMTPEPIPLEVIYEDEQVIVVVKPAGMLVHPTLSVKSGTLANALAYHLNKVRIEGGRWTIAPAFPLVDSEPVVRPGMIHRLDRSTSGLIVLAKTPRALTVLSRHFRKRLVEKRYVALVDGGVEEQAGSISAPIGRDPDQRPRWRVMDGGRHAETKFRVLERMAQATLLELEPVTGRTNQLRIHCAYIGHPIIGDEMYGSCADVQPGSRNTETMMRLCLHASSLAFHHPVSGEWLEFTSPLPDDFSVMVERYRD
jgi:23S rRNA pseudouridine1911/1915/1917 synthase